MVLDEIKEKLKGHARSLFLALATLQLVYNMGMLLVRGQLDMQSFTSTLLRQVVMFGIFFFLVNQAPDIFDTIIRSFRIAASSEGVADGMVSDAIKPGEIYARGIYITSQLNSMAWQKSSILRVFGVGELSYAQAIYISLICLVILLAFAVMTAIYTLALVKWYFICTASMLFLGFGGSEWSNDIAKNAFKTVFSIGAEIFVILLISSVATKITDNWLQQLSNTKTEGATLMIRASTMAAMSFIIAILTVTAPSLASGLISGSAIGAGGTAGAGAMAGAAAMAPVSMMARAGMSKAGKMAGSLTKKGASKLWEKAKRPTTVGDVLGIAKSDGGNSVKP